MKEGGKEICGYLGVELSRQGNGKSQSPKKRTCLALWRKAGAETGEGDGDVDGEGSREAPQVAPP